MIFPVKNLAVNWIDGMKVTKDNFIETDKHHHDIARDIVSLSLTGYNYGLLPAQTSTKEAFDLRVSENSASGIHLKLYYCNAITVNGCRICLTTDSPVLSAFLKNEKPVLDSNSESKSFDVVLTANPFDRVPAGNPDPEENPPRHPFTDSTYKLHIIPSEQLNYAELGTYYLIIGKVKSKEGYFELENYIPPCTAVTSHSGLVGYYENLGSSADFIHNTSLKIMQKIFEKNKPSSIAKNFSMLCEKILGYTTNLFFLYRNSIPFTAPIYLVDAMSTLANLIRTTLYLIPPEEREELLKYIFEWCEVTPNAFEEELVKAIDIRYDHNNIIGSMDILTHFTQMLSAVWNKMNSLEYIGQRRESIVVKNEVVKQVEPTKKRWSILD